MFELSNDLLDTIKGAILGYPQLVHEGPDVHFGCMSCSAACKSNCSSTCRGSCKNSCTRSCKGNSR